MSKRGAKKLKGHSSRTPTLGILREHATSRGSCYTTVKQVKRTQHVQNPVKRRRLTQDEDPNPMNFFFEDFGLPEEPLTHTAPTTQNDYMRHFQENEDVYLFHILRRQGTNVTQMICAQCGKLGLWKCLSCFGEPTYCQNCCRNLHMTSPFHRVRKWNGSFFEDDWLMNTGVTLHIGHGGLACPESMDEEHMDAMGNAMPAHAESPSVLEEEPVAKLDLGDTFNFDTGTETNESDGDSDCEETEHDCQASTPPGTIPDPMEELESSFFESYGNIWKETRKGAKHVVHVVHENGLHPLLIDFCDCPGPEQYLQFLECGLFPASTKTGRIRTAFTFSCLDDYLTQNLECKTAAMSYFSKLARLTSNAFPMTVPDRYRELRRVGRQWRRLKALMRHGFGHRAKKPGPGDLTIFCPVCPQPGINVFEEDMEDPESDLYMRQFVMDGNFSAVHQKQDKPEDDVWLSDGSGFMVGKDSYAEHLRVAKTYPPPKGCNNHHAATDNTERVGCDVTGIGALCCLRNGFFIPHSVVNFQKGEQQKNMDYAVSQALNSSSMDGIRKALLVYDIMCQWQAKFVKRFTKEPHLNLPEHMEVRKAIGDMHIRGHVRECYPRYTLAYIDGAGVIDGEILETNWAVTNEIAGTVRGASLATRSEVLDDHMNYSNFKKLINIVPTLLKKFGRAQRLLIASTSAFQRMNSSSDQDLVREWGEKAEKAKERRSALDIKAMDYFAVKEVNGPGQASQKLKLTQAEEQGGRTGLVAFLCSGIAIQETQLALRTAVRAAGRYPTTTQATDISERRGRLREKISSHQRSAPTFLSIPYRLREDYEEVIDDELPNEEWAKDDLPIVSGVEIENFIHQWW